VLSEVALSLPPHFLKLANEQERLIIPPGNAHKGEAFAAAEALVGTGQVLTSAR
jgi:hypothetical protein